MYMLVQIFQPGVVLPCGTRNNERRQLSHTCFKKDNPNRIGEETASLAYRGKSPQWRGPLSPLQNHSTTHLGISRKSLRSATSSSPSDRRSRPPQQANGGALYFCLLFCELSVGQVCPTIAPFLNRHPESLELSVESFSRRRDFRPAGG